MAIGIWWTDTVRLRMGLSRSLPGKERDAATGLDYFGARYMSSAQGRFTSPDPVFMTKARVYDPQQWNQYAYVRNNPMIYIDPDGRELRLAVYNSSQYSRDTVQRAANIVVARLKSAGVQNVSFEVRQGVPSASDQARQGLVGLLGFVTGSQHSHLAEVRSSRKGEGLLNSGIKEGEAGRNFNASSAVDASQVQQKAGDEDKAVVGLANLMTHELGHDVFVGHSESPDNAMFGSASVDWLFNPNLTFSQKQATALRKRFNTQEEQRQAERDKERQEP